MMSITKASAAGGAIEQSFSERQIFEHQMKALNELPGNKSWPFNSGVLFLGTNAGLVGFICNSYFRRMLMVRKALVLSSLPLGTIPAASTLGLWQAFINKPILFGDVSCPICIQMRGATLNFAIGVFLPFSMSLLMNAYLATVYRTTALPQLSKKTNMKEVFNFWIKKTRFFKYQFLSIALFQIAVGGFIADRSFVLAETELDSFEEVPAREEETLIT